MSQSAKARFYPKQGDSFQSDVGIHSGGFSREAWPERVHVIGGREYTLVDTESKAAQSRGSSTSWIYVETTPCEHGFALDPNAVLGRQKLACAECVKAEEQKRKDRPALDVAADLIDARDREWIRAFGLDPNSYTVADVGVEAFVREVHHEPRVRMNDQADRLRGTIESLRQKVRAADAMVVGVGRGQGAWDLALLIAAYKVIQVPE